MNKEIVLKSNLKVFRKKKNLTQEELAKLVGTTRQTIIAIELGQFNPSTKLALIIAMVLDTKIEDLFYLE